MFRKASTWHDRPMRWILRLLANAAALAVATWLLSGITLTAHGTWHKVLVMLVIALIFGIINAIVKPIFKLVTLPILILTLGLFLLVINALLLMLTSWLSQQFGLGWHVEGFWTAVLGALIVSVVSWLLNTFLHDRDEDRVHR